MDLKFRVAARVARPVHEVFEAVADPGKLSNYFTTGGAQGRLETGATVTWDFADFPGAFPVEVVEVVPDRKIRFALAGCGRISANHFEAIAAHSAECELVGVCDVDPAALTTLIGAAYADMQGRIQPESPVSSVPASL